MRWVARAVFLLVNLAAMTQLDALGWRLGWAKSRGTDIGGYVSYTLDRIGARRKHAMIALAGPLANILFAGMLAAILLLQGALPLLVQSMTAALLILSAGAGLANLIPFEGSDGATIWKSVFRRSRYSGR